jgi:hypothetical protein
VIPVVSASEFVSGGHIDARRLAATLVGGVLISYFAGLWQFIGSLASLVGDLYQRPVFAATELMSTALSIPGAVLMESWRIAGQWFATFGVFAYPMAAVVSVVGLIIIRAGLGRMGVI